MGTASGLVGRPRTAAGAVMALVAAAMLIALVAARPRAPRSGRSGARSSTVWLCRPGQRPDPCAYHRAATAVTGSGATSVSTSSPPLRSAQKFDCFYVYPTVSTEQSNNANLAIQPAELAAAASQASRFSQVHRVWAPMYRQATVPALTRGSITRPTVSNIAYASLLAGWRDYLRPRQRRPADRLHRPLPGVGDPHPPAAHPGRPFARLRRQLVSAIILGGNVQVPTGGPSVAASSTFRPARRPPPTGCVIAYSTFGSHPARGLALRPPRTGRQRPVRADQAPAAAGGLRQPGDLLQRHRVTAALLPVARGTKVPGITVPTPWVTLPWPLHGPVPVGHGDLAAGDGHARRRATLGRR